MGRQREREKHSSEKLKRIFSSLFYSYLTSTGVGSDKSWEERERERVCVCVCEKERETERESRRDREKEISKKIKRFPNIRSVYLSQTQSYFSQGRKQ